MPRVLMGAAGDPCTAACGQAFGALDALREIDTLSRSPVPGHALAASLFRAVLSETDTPSWLLLRSSVSLFPRITKLTPSSELSAHAGLTLTNRGGTTRSSSRRTATT